MTIIYPITAPETVANSVKFTPVSVVAQSTSPFTLEQEIFEHQGQMWSANFKFPSMNQDQGEEWVSFLLKLNGIQGTFLIGDPVGKTPRGSPFGSPVTDGDANQRSKVLATTGWTPGLLIFKAGDYIQLPNYRLHKVLSDTISDGSGNAVLDIFPRLRDNVASGTALIVENTVGIFRLSKGIPSYDVQEAVQYGINIDFREAI